MSAFENGDERVEKRESEDDYRLKTFQSSLNLLSHILIGLVNGAAIVYSFRTGLPLGGIPIHIVLCVLGYQLLMAEAILSLSPHNGWSSHLRLVDKKRAHWVLQLLGSGMAIAGSVVIILEKASNEQDHFNTLHGQFGLVALVATCISLINGLTSLYAYEIRRAVPLPPKLSKVTHICFGIVAFAGASISLAYGFEKTGFTNWSGEGNAYSLIALTACFTLIIIIAPFLTMITRIRS